jgi:hypothetical protein
VCLHLLFHGRDFSLHARDVSLQACDVTFHARDVFLHACDVCLRNVFEKRFVDLSKSCFAGAAGSRQSSYEHVCCMRGVFKAMYTRAARKPPALGRDYLN